MNRAGPGCPWTAPRGTVRFACPCNRNHQSDQPAVPDGHPRPRPASGRNREPSASPSPARGPCGPFTPSPGQTQGHEDERSRTGRGATPPCPPARPVNRNGVSFNPCTATTDDRLDRGWRKSDPLAESGREVERQASTLGIKPESHGMRWWLHRVHGLSGGNAGSRPDELMTKARGGAQASRYAEDLVRQSDRTSCLVLLPHALCCSRRRTARTIAGGGPPEPPPDPASQTQVTAPMPRPASVTGSVN